MKKIYVEITPEEDNRMAQEDTLVLTRQCIKYWDSHTMVVKSYDYTGVLSRLRVPPGKV